MHNLQLKATRVCNSARRPAIGSKIFGSRATSPDGLSLKREDKPVAPLDFVIIRKEQERRRRQEEEAGVPLHIEVPQQVPPGWVPDPNSYGGYIREGDLPRQGPDRGVTILQM